MKKILLTSLLLIATSAFSTSHFEGSYVLSPIQEVQSTCRQYLSIQSIEDNLSLIVTESDVSNDGNYFSLSPMSFLFNGKKPYDITRTVNGVFYSIAKIINDNKIQSRLYKQQFLIKDQILSETTISVDDATSQEIYNLELTKKDKKRAPYTCGYLKI